VRRFRSSRLALEKKKHKKKAARGGRGWARGDPTPRKSGDVGKDVPIVQYKEASSGEKEFSQNRQAFLRDCLPQHEVHFPGKECNGLRRKERPSGGVESWP